MTYLDNDAPAAPPPPPFDPATGRQTSLDLGAIRTNGGTQSRAGLSEPTLQEYTEVLRGSLLPNVPMPFPPLTVYYDGATYWLADGFHRHAAAIKAGLRSFPATIHQGTQRDAILASLGANQSHGLRRTNDDKQRAVLLLLNDAEWATWSNRRIADVAGVSPDLVNRLRPPDASTTRQGADGKTRDVSKIATANAQRALDRTPPPPPRPTSQTPQIPAPLIPGLPVAGGAIHPSIPTAQTQTPAIAGLPTAQATPEADGDEEAEEIAAVPTTPAPDQAALLAATTLTSLLAQLSRLASQRYEMAVASYEVLGLEPPQIAIDRPALEAQARALLDSPALAGAVSMLRFSARVVEAEAVEAVA